jgi:serine/threonine-protein kinase
VIHPGRIVGNIRLVSRLGEGGMAQVWLGQDMKLDRPVAVKVVQEARRFDDHSRARFLREARLLSRLDHPNICRILEFVEDGGADFIVLERLEGDTLAQRLDEGPMDTSAALDVAIQIATALTAAHAMSIVHRDLKPENVMLTTAGIAKVLDFGLARSVSEKADVPLQRQGHVSLADRDGPAAPEGISVTRLGEVMGTPRFMSPEQARGETVTAASDVYSFGLVLQRLLTGVEPYPAGITQEQLLRKAMWGDRLPPGPSAPRLLELIDQMTDLEPSARPSSAEVLHRLEAHRDAPRIRRRRWALAAAIGALSALVVALAVTLGQVRRHAARAEREAEVARQTTTFLTDLFEVADPHRGSASEITAADLLERGTDDIRRRLVDQPDIRSRLLATLGAIHGNLGEYEEGEALLREALAIEESRIGPDSPTLAGPIRRLGWTLSQEGKLEEADAVLARAEPLAARLGDRGIERAAVLHHRMIIRGQQGRFEESEALGREALAIREEVLGPDHRDTGLTLAMLGLAVLDAGRYREAEGLLDRALKIEEANYPEDHPLVVQCVVNLATARKELGRYREAEEMTRSAIDRMVRRLGREHPKVAIAENDLGVILFLQNRHNEAAVTYRRAADIAEASLGPGHPLVGMFLGNLAEATYFDGRSNEAMALYDRALAVMRAALGDDHPALADALAGKAAVAQSLGDFAAADDLLHKALALREAALGIDHPEYGRALAKLADLYMAQGRRQDAVATLQQAEKVLVGALGPDHIDVTDLKGRLAELQPSGRN